MTGKSREYRARLLTLDRLTPDVWRLGFEFSGGDVMEFQAGQHAKLEFPEIGTRDFSIASTPREAIVERRIEFHIRATHGGSFASMLERGLLASGVELKLRGPFGGSFLTTDDPRSLLLLAGGSGLAPMLSMVRTAVDRGLHAPVRLLVGMRSEAEVYGEDVLAALKARDARFQFEFVLSTSTETQGRRLGLVTDVLAQDHADLRGMRIHLAGPPAMLAATIAYLRGRGVSPGDIHADGHVGPIPLQRQG
jgi:CDP-4-dehydro-6-deoxyglucose reductase/ferredoxin-NAD(P)+ reductase (naphthalene dioxygenase ferredoxin-specific)